MNKISIIFLDIDGVLCTERMASMVMVPLPEFSTGYLPFRRGFHQFAGECVEKLNRIIKQTGADIVVSSSWRIGFLEDPKVLFDYIKYQGVVGNIIDITGRDENSTGRRGFEIQEWLDNHPEVTNMAILDDGSDMEHLTPYLVYTSWENGIEEHNVREAIEILGREYKTINLV